MNCKRHRSGEAGVTLIEVLAAIVISGMLATILLTVLWSSALRSNNLIGYNAAQRQVTLVNHVLTQELHKASFVQVDQTGSGVNQTIILWLYSNGFYNSGNTTDTSSPEWEYSTNQIIPSTSNNISATQPQIVGAVPFGALEFVEGGSSSSWNITLFNVSSTTTSVTGCPSTSPLTNTATKWSSSGVGIEWEFPSSLAQENCEFVNSFVIRLSQSYQSSNGQSLTYYLTAGYHDGLLR